MNSFNLKTIGAGTIGDYTNTPAPFGEVFACEDYSILSIGQLKSRKCKRRQCHDDRFTDSFAHAGDGSALFDPVSGEDKHRQSAARSNFLDRRPVLDAMCEFIIYACPTNVLADQLDTYFRRAKTDVGTNAAHAYMPHCTLTGFFHDEPASIPIYRQALTEALSWVQCTAPVPKISINGMVLYEDSHYLQIESTWLQSIIRRFALLAESPMRSDALRLKDWLHLSLAYGFAPIQHKPLVALAHELINLHVAVGWRLRLYERRGNDWQLHHDLALSP